MLRVRDITAHGVAVYPPGARFGPRQILDCEFVWMIEGDAVYERDGAEIAAPQGSVVLCRPGAVDGFGWDKKRPTRHGFFHFVIEHVPSDWPAIWPTVLKGSEAGVVTEMFRYVLAWSGAGRPSLRTGCIGLMLEMFVFGQGQSREVARAGVPEVVEKAMTFVDRTLNRQVERAIGLDSMAAAANVSGAHLCRAMKRAIGRTPAEYVRLVRLDRGAVLVTRTNYSIKEISGMVGFQSPFHFSRRFREAYGMSPSQLRDSVTRGESAPLPRLVRTHLV